MHRAVQLSVRRAALPDDRAWDDALRVAEALAAEHDVPVRLIEGLAFYLDLPSETDPRVDTALRALRAAAARSGVTWQEYRTVHYDDADLAVAGLLVVTGVGVDGDDRRFLVNEDGALEPDDGCPVCNSHRPEHRRLRDIPRVIPELVFRPAATVDIDGAPRPDRRPAAGWDAVNLVNRAMVVSARLLAADPSQGRGLNTAPVADPAGRILDQLSILLATRTARICPQHSNLPPDGVCPRCGTVLAEQSAPALLSVRESEVAGLDAVSTGMRLHGPLAVRPRLIRAWRTAGVEGISPIRPMLLCAH